MPSSSISQWPLFAVASASIEGLIAMTITPYKWTIERYHRAIDAGLFDDQPVELLRGDIVVMPPEREPHAYYNSEVGDYLRALLGNRVKIPEAHPITLPNNSEPAPDLAIVKPLGAVYLEHHPYPDDIFWLIEFSNITLDYRQVTEKLYLVDNDENFGNEIFTNR
jgi:Uma2 family endonuclease